MTNQQLLDATAEANPDKRRIDDARVKELTLQGKSIRQIAAILDCSTSTVGHARARTGTNTGTRGARRKVDLNKLRELDAQGLRREEIADYFGCSPDRVTAARKQAGLPKDTRHHGRRPVINYDAVRELTEQGRTAEQIAHTLGCTPRAVYDIRGRLGITDQTHRPLTPEKRALIEAAIADGWSQSEICRTYHVAHGTMHRHYPDAKWDKQQRADHIRATRLEAGFNWGHQRRDAAA